MLLQHFVNGNVIRGNPRLRHILNPAAIQCRMTVSIEQNKSFHVEYCHHIIFCCSLGSFHFQTKEVLKAAPPSQLHTYCNGALLLVHQLIQTKSKHDFWTTKQSHPKVNLAADRLWFDCNERIDTCPLSVQ